MSETTRTRSLTLWVSTAILALIAGLLTVLVATPAQADHITYPTCPSTTVTRTGNQTSAVYQNNSNGTWDLTGAVWSDPSTYPYPIRSDSWGTGCVLGSTLFGPIDRAATRNQWYNAGTHGGEDHESIRLNVSSSGYALIRDQFADDVEDGIDTNGASEASRTYVDHVHFENIRDDCIENEDTVHDMYVRDSLFDGCFTFLAEKPAGSSVDAGTNAGVDFILEDSLVYVNPQPLGSSSTSSQNYCNEDKVAAERCINDPNSNSGWSGNYGFFKIDADAAENMVIKNTIFRMDVASYSSCSGNRFPTNATFTNTTLVWTGPGTWQSAGGCNNVVPSGMTVTNDVSVWNNAKAAWLNESPPPPSNVAPTVNAGTDQSITLPSNASLDGTVSDDGLPTGSSVTSTWTETSGPGTVTFANANAVDTTATFSEAGTYVLRLTSTDGALSANDEVTVTVEAEPPPPSNTAPSVNAGSDQSITLPDDNAALDGTVSDDGLPTGSTVTSTWSETSGPGDVTFTNSNAVDTTATFSAAGTYVLRLTSSDGDLSAFDETTVTVHPENNPPPTNQAPSVNAGVDTEVELPASLNLDGTASDDGLPTGSSLSTTWSKVSGPGTVTFGNASAVDTTASFSVDGLYVLRLSGTDGALTSTDDVQVWVDPDSNLSNERPMVDAGPDQTITLPDNDAVLNADVLEDGLPNPPGVTTVQWAKFSGPGTVTFANATAIDTTATFSAAGTYVLSLTANDSALTDVDYVTITVNPEPPTGISYVGSAEAQAGSHSVVQNLPANLQTGDTVVFQVVENKGDRGVINTPSGLTSVGGESDDGGSLGSEVFKCVVGSGCPETSVTFTTTPNSGESNVYQISTVAFAYRGVTTVSQVAVDIEGSSDVDQHPITGTTTTSAWNLVLAADRELGSNETASNWTFDGPMDTRREGGHCTNNSTAGCISQGVADTAAAVPAGTYTYKADADNSTKYAITRLVQFY